MAGILKSFVTEKEIEEGKKKKQEEWERVRQPDQPMQRPEEKYDGRTLYDRLKLQKDAKREEVSEQLKFKNQIYKGLDDEESEFLRFVAERRANQDEEMYRQEIEEVAAYREAVANLEDEKQLSRVGGGRSGESLGRGKGSDEPSGGVGEPLESVGEPSGGVFWESEKSSGGASGRSGVAASGDKRAPPSPTKTEAPPTGSGRPPKASHKSQLSLIAGSIKAKRRRTASGELGREEAESARGELEREEAKSARGEVGREDTESAPSEAREDEQETSPKRRKLREEEEEEPLDGRGAASYERPGTGSELHATPSFALSGLTAYSSSEDSGPE